MSISWDRLPYALQFQLARAASRDLMTSAIPFLVPKDPRLSGTEFRHELDRTDLGGIEVHYASETSPGAAVAGAWQLLAQRRLPRVPLHAHLLKEFPQSKLVNEPQLTALRLADLAQRADLLAQYIGLRLGYELSSVSTRGTTPFKVVQATELRDAFDHFGSSWSRYYRGRSTSFDWSRYRSWVAFRPPVVKYRNPALWGLEYRALLPEYSDQLARLVLDAIHGKMDETNWPLSEPLAAAILRPPDLEFERSPQQLIVHGWYNLPIRYNELASQLLPPAAAVDLLRVAEVPPELRMVLHNWNASTLTAQNEALQLRIRDVQAALVRDNVSCRRRGGLVQCTASDPQYVALLFLERSGLAQNIAASLGIPWPALQAAFQISERGR